LLHAAGASLKTTQELMRHASPDITLGIYAKAVTADKRQAQNMLAALFVGAKPERPKRSNRLGNDYGKQVRNVIVPFRSQSCSHCGLEVLLSC
jgi:hypothetical protein